MPTEAQLEKALRNAVRTHFQDPERVGSSPNALRAHAEKELGLKGGFFKNEKWKSRSKEIIQDQFNKGADDKGSEGETPAKPSKGVKRASASSSPQPKKKTKVSKVQDEEAEESTALSEPPESDEESEFEEEKPVMKRGQQKQTAKVEKEKPQKAQMKAKPKKKAKSPSPVFDDEEEDKLDYEEEAPPSKSKTTTAKSETADDTSSELSSVIDDQPPPTKSKRSSTTKNGTSKSSTSGPSLSSSKSKSQPDSSPEAEEIKRLQGWLVKCGVRKVWGKELKPYETPKAKINHLRSMLADVGMTGRYSNEKAAQIKEARELAADIEAVQEGNERWGKTDESEEEAGARQRGAAGEAKDGGEPAAGVGRRLVRGAKNYDFLSSDGEETD